MSQKNGDIYVILRIGLNYYYKTADSFQIGKHVNIFWEPSINLFNLLCHKINYSKLGLKQFQNNSNSIKFNPTLDNYLYYVRLIQ